MRTRMITRAALLVVALLLAACQSADATATGEQQNENSAAQAPADLAVSATPTPSTPSPGQPQSPAKVAAAATAAEVAATGQAEQPQDEAALVDTARVETTPVETLRDVDFENGFRYTSSNVEGRTGPVVDGEYVNGEFGDLDFYWFLASAPVFVDLDADGVEEAAVRTSWNGGGSGFFDSIQVFGLVDGQPVEAAVSGYGDRAFGGIAHVGAADGWLVVDTYTDGDGSCCPHTMVRERLRLIGDRLVTAESHAPVRVVAVQPWADEPVEVTFLPDTSHAVLELPSTTDVHTVRFDAQAGQHVTLTLLDGVGVSSLSLTHIESGTTKNFPQATVLDRGGLHELKIEVGRAMTDPAIAQLWTRLLLSITSDEPELVGQPQWTTERYTVVVAEEPVSVVADVSYPSFEGHAEANAAIAAWVVGEVDPWIAYASDAELPRDDNLIEGSFEMHYRVTLAGPGVASIRFSFYEYLCCRPYPNYGYRSLTVDLADGRILSDDDLVDLDRVDELEALWFDALRSDDSGGLGDWDPADHFGAVEGGAWQGLGLSPAGVWISTDRQGAMTPTVVVIAFAELGSLVDPSIAALASSAIEPSGF